MRSLLAGLERSRVLDRVAGPAQAAAEAAIPGEAVRDTLHGRWFGHPLHPAIVQFPVGAWLSTAVLDLLPGRRARERRRAATMLLIAGTAGALPAAVTGAVDFTTLTRAQQRVAVVHAAANTAALGFFVASIAARLRGRHDTGRRLTLAGVGIAGASAYLGGHLAFSQGAGASHASAALPLVPAGWHDLGPVTAFHEGQPVSRVLGETPVLVHREGGRFSVLVARCAHQGGPLSEGATLRFDGAACVECPWHGSVFRLADGRAMRGPTGSDQPALRTRVRAGVLQAARP